MHLKKEAHGAPLSCGLEIKLLEMGELNTLLKAQQQIPRRMNDASLIRHLKKCLPRRENEIEHEQMEIKITSSETNGTVAG